MKKSVSEAADRLENRCNSIKEQIFTVKENILTKASDIVREAKLKGKIALNKVSEFFGVKKKLESIRENVKASQVEVAGTIAKIDVFGKGLREAHQQIANTFRTFADKETIDYSAKEKKFSKTEAMKQPWIAKKKLLEGMQFRLDAAIDKLDNLSKDVKISKMMKLYDEAMKRPHENLAVAVAEPEVQYGADAFDTFAKSEAAKGEQVQNGVEIPKKEARGDRIRQ